MNLALQTRRAVITLSLVALAMVCVAAKTATRTDAALAADAPPRIEAVTRGAFEVSAGPASVYCRTCRNRREGESERTLRQQGPPHLRNGPAACGIIAACCMWFCINRRSRRIPAT